MNARYQEEEGAKFSNQRIEVKLNSCGSVSIANSAFLINIKTCKEYRIPSVSLKGIGGETEPLTKAEILENRRSPGSALYGRTVEGIREGGLSRKAQLINCWLVSWGLREFNMSVDI